MVETPASKNWLALAAYLTLIGYSSLNFAATFEVDRFDDPFPANVCDSGVPSDCSLREAIDQANATPGADIIVLPAGTYQLTRTGAAENANFVGDIDITDTVLITGAGMDLTILDAGGVTGLGDRVIHALAGSGVEIEDLSITGAVGTEDGAGVRADAFTILRRVSIYGNSTIGAGGAVVADARLQIIDSILRDNTAGFAGGAIVGFTDILEVLNSQILDNQAGALGGGIWAVGSSLTISNSLIDGNQLTEADSDGGGVVVGISSSADISLTTISDNYAEGTGGGIFNDGILTLDNVNLLGNVADTNGGGLYVGQNLLVMLDSVTLANNSAPIGAVMEVTSTNNAFMTNLTVSNNDGAFFPVRFFEAQVVISQATILENEDMTVAGALAVVDSDLTIGNSIVGGGCSIIAINSVSSIFSAGGNIELAQDSCFFATVIAGGFELGPVQDNGGFTLTRLPDEDGPAIDAGENANCTSLSSDQRGFQRDVDFTGGGPVCDVGAVELQLNERQRIFRDSLES